MTYVETNDYGQDIYGAEVPADIDYIKFSDGSAANERTNNIASDNIADSKGYYLTEKVSGKWNVGTYDYIPATPVEPTTVAPTTVTATTAAPTEAPTAAPTAAPTEAPTVAPTAAPTEAPTVAPTTAPTEAPTTEPTPVEPETIKIYFTNNEDWVEVYVYGFYGVEGGTATGEPLGTYPGTKMTYVETNDYGQDIYGAEIPADIDYIKFSDGSAANERTNNIASDIIADNKGYYLSEKVSGKWNVGTYDYVPATPVEPTTAATTATTGTVAPTDTPVVEPTTVAPTVAPTEPPVTTEYTVYFVNSGKWSKVNAYVWSPELSTWPGTAMTKTGEKAPNGADVYSLTVSETYDNIIFNDGSSQTSDLTFEVGKYYDYATGKWYAALDEISDEQPTGYTVYCVNSNNWSKINAYVWNPNGAGWPGAAMTKTGEKAANGADIYSITFAENHGNIIFNNGSSQTADLTFQAGQYYDLATNKWYASAADIK